MAEVMVLLNTPSFISAGQIEKVGYTYIWAHGFLPCLVNNDSGSLVVFDVCSDQPIMLKGGFLTGFMPLKFYQSYAVHM